jgi:ribosomal protein L7/L12
LLRQERKLDAILQHLNIDWRSDVDPQLLKLIERGTRIEAVKAYKELNDVTLREAIDYVTSLRND